MRELNEENLFDDDIMGEVKEYYTNLKYSFLQLSPNDLPMSSWETLEQDAEIFGKKKILNDIRKIQKLERSIINKGYNKNYPVTLEYIPKDKKSVIGMENHRIQAVRNLIERKQLYRNFKIPIMIIIHNDKLRWKLRNKYKKLRRQKKEAIKK